MSTIEPPEDDIFRFMEEQMGEVVVEVEDVTKIPDHELGLKVKELDKLLSDMGQLHNMNPTTESAREAHSRRSALLIEMARRGLR
jgi:hypothetical protein